MYQIKESYLENVRKTVSNMTLVVLGGNGSLGISLAYCLKYYNIMPVSIVVISLNSDLDHSWFSIGCPIKHIRASETTTFTSTFSSCIDRLSREYLLFYMAGYGQPNKFLTDPGGVVDANVTQLSSILSINKRPRLLAYISTAEIYSGISTEAFEDTPSIVGSDHMRAVYVRAKLLGEAIVTSWAQKYSVRAASYRVALAFPPKLIRGDTRVLGELLEGGLSRGSVILKGGSQLMRQYQFGPNALIQILSSLINGTSLIYNSAGDHHLSLGELARLVSEATFASLQILNTNSDQSSQSTMNVNFNRINTEAGVEPSSHRTLAYYIKEVVDATNNAR